MTTPFDWVSRVSEKKPDPRDVDSDALSQYVPFIVNRALSYHRDAVLYVNEMNLFAELDADMQADYYFGALPKRRRFSKWGKAKRDLGAAALSKVYGMGTREAAAAVRALTPEQINTVIAAAAME